MALGRAILAFPVLLAMAGCAGGKVRDEPAAPDVDAISDVVAAPGGGKAEPNSATPDLEASPGLGTENQAVPPQNPSPEAVPDQDMAAADGSTKAVAGGQPSATGPAGSRVDATAAGKPASGDPAAAAAAIKGGDKPGEEGGLAAKRVDRILAVGENGRNKESAAGRAVASATDGKSATIENSTVEGIPSAIGGAVSTERFAAAAEGTESVSPDKGSVTTSPGPAVDMGDPGADELNRLAALPPQSSDGDATTEAGEKPKGKLDDEDRSLRCDVVELLGRSIGQWRLRGEEQKSAADKAIDEIVRATGGERDRRFVFGGRVYGMLIYELKKDHTSEGFGAYAHAACLILRGHRGLIPADDTSAAQLDQALRSCESGAPETDELNDCISKRMEQIVRERGRPSG